MGLVLKAQMRPKSYCAVPNGYFSVGITADTESAKLSRYFRLGTCVEPEIELHSLLTAPFTLVLACPACGYAHQSSSASGLCWRL